MKGLFIPGITTEMFRNECLESIEALMAEGEIYDIEYQPWISVSERLPDIEEHYESKPCLCYCSNGVYCFGELEQNIFGQVGWDCEKDDDYYQPAGEVIAWMPLPEPYREREN